MPTKLPMQDYKSSHLEQGAGRASLPSHVWCNQRVADCDWSHPHGASSDCIKWVVLLIFHSYSLWFSHDCTTIIQLLPWYTIKILSLQVKDLVKFGLLTLMIRTFYYLIGTYFYLNLVGGIVFSTSFDQFFDWFLSGFWWFWVVSWSHSWRFMIYHDHIWQLYMQANFPNNPAGNEIIFRISTSLHPANIQCVVYYWILLGYPALPRTILSLGIQGWNHHKFMVI